MSVFKIKKTASAASQIKPLFGFIFLLVLAGAICWKSFTFLEKKTVPKKDWQPVTTAAEWEGRGYAPLVVFKNELWVLGGITTDFSTPNNLSEKEKNEALNYDPKIDPQLNVAFSTGGKKFNDVWHSPDGGKWIKAASSASWSPRRSHTTAVFADKIWIMGGYEDGNNLNDVWYSADGINWNLATDHANWEPRRGHATLVFDNKLWVIGGAGGDSSSGWDNTYNDVWYSTNGVDWKQVDSFIPWKRRNDHASLVFDNKIWIIGGWKKWGENHNDVWYSADGANWTAATLQAPWSPRWGMSVVAYAGKMWMIGGNFHSEVVPGEESGDLNEVWSSRDGETWVKEDYPDSWPPRRRFGAVTWKDKIWLAGGLAGKYKKDIRGLNDVWSLDKTN